MKNAIWIYPWDIADLGLGAVSAELAALGFDTLSIATAYHAGRFLQVRSPRRRAYFPEDGAIYFRPDPTLWQGQGVQPLQASLVAEVDVLGAAVAARDAGGLAVSCWTVCLHNSALGLRHPEVITRNAYGDGTLYNLCPANPLARDYVVTLVRDISHNYQPNRIELESPNFMGFAHGYHHEKDMVGLPPEGDLLMSLCFCDSCQAAGRAQGLDMAALAARVRGLIDQICQAATPTELLPDYQTQGLAAFGFDAELLHYLQLRHTHVEALLGAVKSACHPNVELLLIDGPEGWRGGCDYGAIRALGVELLLCSYGQSEAQARDLLSGTGAQVGLRLDPHDYPDRAALAARLALLQHAGARGVNIYNYGLVPQARLNWLAGLL